MKAGTGKSTLILPNEIWPIQSFSKCHDDLHVRSLILESSRRFVFMSIEMTSLPDYAIEKIKQKIIDLYPVPKENIWISVTHTFSSPHLRSQQAIEREGESVLIKNQMLEGALDQACTEALLQARESIQEVLIGFGYAYCGVNVNRDIQTSQGWWLGANDMGFSDKSVSLIRIDALDHHPLCVVYSYDVQSSIMSDSYEADGFREVSSDLAGRSSLFIENQYDDLVALFLIGASGDQAPMFQANHTLVNRKGEMIKEDIGEKGFVFVNALGGKLGSQVVNGIEKITTSASEAPVTLETYTIQVPAQTLPDMKALHPAKNYAYRQDGFHDVSFDCLTLGDIALIAIKPELNSMSAMTVKEHSPYPMTCLLTLVNGGMKYMGDESSYDRCTYEAMNSMFGSGSAEILCERMVHVLIKRRREDENRNI